MTNLLTGVREYDSMLSMTTHHFPIIDDIDDETFLDDADCAYCSDRITRNRGERWANASGEATCALAPDMTENANGTRYCNDCQSIVILFDDDIHYCRPAWHRVVDSGIVAPTDSAWSLYERDADDEIHSPVMGWMDCIYRRDGVDTDGTEYFRCVVHDSVTMGHEVSCEGASYAHAEEVVHLDSGPRDGSPFCGAENSTESENDINSVTCAACIDRHDRLPDGS